MITVQEAGQLIQKYTTSADIESVPFDHAVNRIIREAVYSDRPLPPFNRVMMDGICIRYADFESGNRTFPIQSTQPAGAPQITLERSNTCIEIMTGAILPHAADTVIRYEDLTIQDGNAHVTIEQISPGQNIHDRGIDRKQGELLISPGQQIGAAEVGVLASVGIHQVKVSKLPECAIISTGDELVEVDQNPKPHQIRRSNIYLIQSYLRKYGMEALQFHIPDDPTKMRMQISQLLASNDLLILSGGVSRGKYDYLPEVLEDLKVKKVFHKVRQRPGKPFWFGVWEGKLIFALPGNPVSSFVCLTKYIQDFLVNHLEIKVQSIQAKLSDNFSFKPDLDLFLPVHLMETKGVFQGIPKPGQGSGDFANLLRASGFLHLPRGREVFYAGEVFPYIDFRNLG